MSHSVDRIASMTEGEIRGVWWRLNDPVLRTTCPEQPGERAAIIARAKALCVELEPKQPARRRK